MSGMLLGFVRLAARHFEISVVQGIYLTYQTVKIAVIDDDVVRGRETLSARRLGLEHSVCIDSGQPVTLGNAQPLYRFGGIDDQNAVDHVTLTGLNQQRYSEYAVSCVQRQDALLHLRANARMEYGLQCLALVGMAEHDTAQMRPIQGAVGAEGLGSKTVHDVL